MREKNVMAAVGYLFGGCGLFILCADSEEDKEPVEESKQKPDSVMHRAAGLLCPAWQSSRACLTGDDNQNNWND